MLHFGIDREPGQLDSTDFAFIQMQLDKVAESKANAQLKPSDTKQASGDYPPGPHGGCLAVIKGFLDNDVDHPGYWGL